MGRVIRISIAALVLYAVWQTGTAYWQYLQLADRVERIAQFGGNQADEQVRAAVVEAAAALGVHLDPATIAVRRSDTSLSIAASYVRPIEVFPRTSVDWTFRLDTTAWLIPAGAIRKSPGARALRPALTTL